MTEEVRQALRICPPGLRQAIDRLPEKEKLTILLRFYKGLTQEQVAKVLGVSQVQVSRLERRCCAAFWSRQRSARPMPCRK